MKSPSFKKGRWVFTHIHGKSRNNIYSPAFGDKKLLTAPKLEDMTLQDKYNFLKYSIAWDPSIVSYNSGKINISKLAVNSKLSKSHVTTIIEDMKNHLDKYVDDSDFCSDIKWCFPKTRVSYRPIGPRSKSNS